MKAPGSRVQYQENEVTNLYHRPKAIVVDLDHQRKIITAKRRTIDTRSVLDLCRQQQHIVENRIVQEAIREVMKNQSPNITVPDPHPDQDHVRSRVLDPVIDRPYQLIIVDKRGIKKMFHHLHHHLNQVHPNLDLGLGQDLIFHHLNLTMIIVPTVVVVRQHRRLILL